MSGIKISELIGAYASSMGATSAEELIERKIREAHLERKETYTREEIARLCGELMRDGGLIRILAQNFLVQLEYVAREELEELVQERTRELTETNEELNRAKQHFQALFSAMVDPVVIIDSAGVFVEVTDNVEEVTGFAKEELLGRSFLKTGIVTEESKATISENLAKRRAGANVAPCEVEVLKDGRKLLFEVNAAQITYMEQPADMLIFRDITERKKVGEKLRSLSSVVEQSSEGMAIANLDGILTFANDAWYKMHGYKSSKKLLGKNFAIFHNKEQLEYEVKPFNEKVKELGAYSGEVGHITRDGKPFPTFMTTTLLKSEQGKPYAVVGIARDITEQKRMDEILRESEKKYSSVVENSIDGIIVLQKGIIKFLNQASSNLIGYNLEELIDKGFERHLSPEYQKLVMDRYQARLSGKEVPSTYETEIIRKDGISVPVEVSNTTITYEGEEAILSFIRNITERKKMEDALRIAHGNTRTILEKAPIGVVVIGRDRKIKWVNDTALKMAGVTNADIMLGKNCGEYLCPAQQKECPILDKGQHVDNSERIFRRNDGKETPIIKTVTEINMDGEDVLLETFVDITERKRIEENLRKKQVAEGAYTDILTVTSRTIDLNTIVTEGLSNLMKYTDSPMGVVYLCDRDSKTLLPVVARGARGAVAEQSFLYDGGIVGEAAATKAMVVATDLEDTIYKIPSGDSAVPPDTIISTPIIFKDALLGVILTCYTTRTSPDMIDFVKRVTDQIAVAINNANAYTEIHEMAAELKRERDKLKIASRELAAASRTKSEFLANMSHELRTPLNSIIGFSEILHEGVSGPINEKQAKYVNNVLVSGKHLLQLINDILDLSKVEAGKIELVCEDFSVSDAINEVRALTASIVAKKNIVLDVSVDEGLPVIHADEGKFKQILYNLLSNAIKFTPGYGSVTVCARQSGDMAEISVADTGIGISKEDQKKLFQPFMQADASTSRAYGGTGLGLSLVKKFSELHGGTAWVESEPGEGSTFTFTIPIDYRVDAETPEDTRELEAGTETGSGQGAKAEVAAGAEAEMHGKMREVPAVADAVSAEEIAAIKMPEIIEPAGRSGDEPLILVVEDDKNSSELLTVTLTGAGYRVIPAYNGREALAVAKRLKPFAITLDIMMPGMGGWDVLKYLKYDSETSNIPVIIISMLDEAEVGFSLGVADYFVKPVEKNALIAALNNLKESIGIERPKVLVVDDERVSVELIESMIEPAGFEVIRAYGGEEGIEKSFSKQPDVLILDLMMPDVSGFEVVSRLKTDPETRNIPIIICTSRDPTSEDIIRLRSDVTSVMRKGEFAREELMSEIKSVATLVRR